jgi:hypothetical protein
MRKINFLAAYVLFAGALTAQTSSNSSGGDATGSGGTVAYSVGQVVYTTNQGTSGEIAQGVQQAYEIYSVGIEETELSISIAVYPNPTADKIILTKNNVNLSNLEYQLISHDGKLLQQRSLESNEMEISMKELPTANYFLNILDNKNQKIKSFKIIKTK